MIHELKCWEKFYKYIEDGTKTFEIRYNDRNFQVGDTLYLREYNDLDGVYTGRKLYAEVTYILSNFVGLVEDYIAMQIEVIGDSVEADLMEEEKIPLCSGVLV